MNCPTVAVMAWSADFVDRLVFRLKAFGAPKVQTIRIVIVEFSVKDLFLKMNSLYGCLAGVGICSTTCDLDGNPNCFMAGDFELFIAMFVSVVSSYYLYIPESPPLAPACLHFQDTSAKFEFIEVFAGQAQATRMFRAAQHTSACLDLEYMEAKPGHQNPMDLLTPSGMAILENNGVV